VPYAVAVVERREGTPLLTNIVDIDRHRIRCEMHVVVKFEDLSPGVSGPKFTSAEAQI
jgi:uncharacterized OB-fold protein